MKSIARLIALAAVALGFVLGAPGAHAQGGYADPPTLTVDKTVATVGETVIITGRNFLPNAEVELSYNPPLGQATTDGNGDFTFAWNTTGFAVGEYTVTAADGVNALAVQVTLVAAGATTVPAQPLTPAPAATGLPRTGSDSGMLARAGAGLVAAGALVVLITRRRMQANG